MATIPALDTAVRLAAATLAAVVLAACSVAAGAEPTPPASAVPDPTPRPDFLVDLDIVTYAQVSVAVEDRSGLLTAVSSGLAGSGMSVIWNEVRVVNDDPDTLRVTFVGVPADAVVRLVVTDEGDSLHLAFQQPEPEPGRVWVAFDRVVLIDLERPVDADAVVATMDTVTG